MTLELLRCFVTVCREQSITKAAACLFISKQAVSSNIKSLENELGVTLLTRDHAGVRLSPAGHRLLIHANTMLSQWESCLSEISSMRDDRDTLRVGMAYMARTLWTPEVSQRFATLHPDIPVRILGGYAKDLIKALDEGSLDCVITFRRSEFREHFDAIALYDAPLSFLMSSGDPLATKPLIQPRDLASRIVLFHQSGASYLDELAAWLKGQGIVIQPRLIEHSVLSVEQDAIESDGALSLRNAVYHAAEPQTIGFVSRLADMDAFRGAPPLTICALYPKGTAPSLNLLSFAAFFRTRLQSC